MKNEFSKQLKTIYKHSKNNYQFYFMIYQNKKKIGTLVLENYGYNLNYSPQFYNLRVYCESCSESIQDLIYRKDKDFENFIKKLIEKLESINLKNYIKRNSHLSYIVVKVKKTIDN